MADTEHTVQNDPVTLPAGIELSGQHTLAASYEALHIGGAMKIPGKLVVNYTLMPR
jgi:hypothetical protein